MARSIRIEYPGAFYHVMARGNRREAIFLDDDDRRSFLTSLGEGCAKTGWRVHAWVLMRNHYHLLVETPEPNLVTGMQWLQNTFTRRFNVRHGQWGRIFGDRYKAMLVEGGDGYYYQTLLDYIHLNPVRAGAVRVSPAKSVMDFPWSSVAGGYVLPPASRLSWLDAAAGLRAFNLPDTASGRRRFVQRLDLRAIEEGAIGAGVPEREPEADMRSSHLRRGWFWGSQGFAEKMLVLVSKALTKPKGRAYRSGDVRRSHDLNQAEKWVRNGLAAASLAESELKSLPGSDPRKVALAVLVWEHTHASQSWIAERLLMRSAANVSQQLCRWKKSGPSRLPRGLQAFLKKQRLSGFEP